ncbi:MAG: Na(+)-translocating NADH-quinone reductase subunit C [Gammaproteobacteria bacterium]|nr:Na(+)-translocating NADH-quinone reductase subunit C [Gammaproteobacteria bacterium]
MPKSDTNNPSWLQKVLSLPNDSIQKTLIVAVGICLVCSVVVAGTTVVLKPIQSANKALDFKRNVVEVAGLLPEGGNVDEAFKQVEIRVVDLDTGEYTDAVDPATFSQTEAAKNPATSEVVPADEDIAKIKRRSKYALVYLVKEDGKLKTLILPVHGYGLWSTLYGLLALDSDFDTVKNLKFYQHAETPGLGGEVENPKWRALWVGKKVYDDKGEVKLSVIKGSVTPDTPDAQYKVDGLSGSTLTSRGVSNLVHYWLGENGFGPFLERLRSQRG